LIKFVNRTVDVFNGFVAFSLAWSAVSAKTEFRFNTDCGGNEGRNDQYGDYDGGGGNNLVMMMITVDMVIVLLSATYFIVCKSRFIASANALPC
jgi:hypothetical protein